MAPVNDTLLKTILLCLCSLVLFSCSTFDFFKKETAQMDPKSAVLLNTETRKETSGSLKQKLDPKKNQNISELEDKITLLENKISQLEERLSNQKPVIYQVAYNQPSQLYQKARTLLLEGDLANAAQLFETFVAQHPRHSLADNAMYWLGECHYSSGQYAKAVTVFKSLVKTYPKAEKVPDALLKTGYAYLSMDDPNRAQHYLKLVLTKYPFSPAAEKAQGKLK
ncbi:MAG: tol-pal system protein YbgF [Proteobacteria bacterium]|nr:tol-pal system protein YbgF [Pseudomonadota bacterium]